VLRQPCHDGMRARKRQLQVVVRAALIVRVARDYPPRSRTALDELQDLVQGRQALGTQLRRCGVEVNAVDRDGSVLLDLALEVGDAFFVPLELKFAVPCFPAGRSRSCTAPS
jgi:hypothetical protein